MNPPNELSAPSGRNMRATCARVLAAALMTGAIAAAGALPALVRDTVERPHALAAPPSSLQRVVRIAPVVSAEQARPPRSEHTSRSPTAPAAASGPNRSAARPPARVERALRRTATALRSRPAASAGTAVAAPAPALEPSRELASTPATAPTATGTGHHKAKAKVRPTASAAPAEHPVETEPPTDASGDAIDVEPLNGNRNAKGRGHVNGG